MDQGRLLADALSFPLPLRLRRPGPRDIGENFDAVRSWIKALEEGARGARGVGYDIGWEDINHRQVGRNRFPAALSIATRAEALAIIGKSSEAERYDALRKATIATLPELGAWLQRKPLTALDHEERWDRVLRVLQWFRTHPRPNIYLRQMDVAGVDTKFIDGRRGLLTELLELVLPADADSVTTEVRDFETRFGFRSKPKLIRFRILDPLRRGQGWTDLTVPLAEFSRQAVDARHVFITENETNALAFPECNESIVIFGGGYAIDQLSSAAWLREREVHYWGDIDTHGFAMLDKLRASLPCVHSLLMDRATLIAHSDLWSVEDAPYVANLDRLLHQEKRVSRWPRARSCDQARQ